MPNPFSCAMHLVFGWTEAVTTSAKAPLKNVKMVVLFVGQVYAPTR